MQSLESLVNQLLPGVNVEDVLASPEFAKTSPSLSGPRTPEASSQTVVTPSVQDNTSDNDPVIPEAVPSSADGFNWQEENVSVDGLTDGMAALSIEPTGVGYLGKALHKLHRSRFLTFSRFHLWSSISSVFARLGRFLTSIPSPNSAIPTRTFKSN